MSAHMLKYVIGRRCLPVQWPVVCFGEAGVGPDGWAMELSGASVADYQTLQAIHTNLYNMSTTISFYSALGQSVCVNVTTTFHA